MNRNRPTHLSLSIPSYIRCAAWSAVTVLVGGLVWTHSAAAVEDPNKVIRPKDTQAGAQQQLIAGSIRDALQVKQGHPKLESALQQLYTAATEQGPLAAQGLSQRQGITDVGGQIQVIVEMEPEPADLVLLQADNGTSRNSETEGLRRRRGLLKQQIEATGITPEAEYRHLLRVRASPDRLVQLADIPEVRSVRLPHRPVPLVVSEGVNLTGDFGYQLAGFWGSGVTVAVIDAGFDGLSEARAVLELPLLAISTHDFTGTGIETGTTHGTAVAEIAFEMAPGATLWLLKIADDVDLGNAKDFAIAHGVNIISMSLGFPGDGFLENAGVTDGIANDARAQGVHWVNSAGNSADGDHWRGQFVDTVDLFLPPFDKLHEFNPGIDELNSFFASAGDTICVWLTWNNWPQSDQDYDIGLFDSTLTLVNGSANLQTGTQVPFEQFCHVVPSGSTGMHHLAIQNAGANGTATFELYKRGGASLEYRVADHSILPPADATGVIAVGAIDEDNWTTGPQEPFSSQGPTNDGRIKPDIMGPDDTASFTYSPQAFLGTSASAPHVAGALALLKQAHLTLTPDQLENLLYTNAIDMGAAGKDNIFGYGRMRLPAPPVLGVSVSPTSWAVGTIPPGTTVQMNESNDLSVNNTGNVAETMTLRIANPGTAWAPGLGAGTESFHLQGLFVGSTDAPGPSDFQADDTLFSGAPVASTATQFGMASSASGFNPDAGGSLTNNLAAYWKLDEASGTRVDSVGANNLTDGNTVTQAVGKVVNAAQFTSANSEYLSIADNATLSTGDIDFTIACWVYFDALGTMEYIVQKFDNSGGAGEEFRLFYDSSVNRFRWAVGSSTTVLANTFGAPSTGTWYFITCYHDSIANSIGIAVNNGTADTAGLVGGPSNGTGPFQIGASDSTGTPGSFMNGRIDEVGFWKRVLTPQERADLYHGGLGNTLGAGGTNGVGVPPGGTRDMWLSFTGPTETTQKNQESIVVEVGAVQTP